MGIAEGMRLARRQPYAQWQVMQYGDQPLMIRCCQDIPELSIVHRLAGRENTQSKIRPKGLRWSSKQGGASPAQIIQNRPDFSYASL